jgi:hypothetical protein
MSRHLLDACMHTLYTFIHLICSTLPPTLYYCYLLLYTHKPALFDCIDFRLQNASWAQKERLIVWPRRPALEWSHRLQ